MAIPIIVWYGAAAAGLVALRTFAARRRPVEFQPKPLAAKPQLVPGGDVVTSDFGIKIGRLQSYIRFPTPIPADVLAAVAGRLLYAGPYDEYTPAMNKLASGGAAAAEQQRGNIRNRAWKAISVGVDGFGFRSPEWKKQNLRFNTIAVAVQDVLGTYTPPPEWWTRSNVTAPGHFPIGQLSLPGQNLVYRFGEVVYGIGCDLWDEKWAQGHTTGEIFNAAKNQSAVGTSEASCRSVQASRISLLAPRLKKLAQDPGYTESMFKEEIAIHLLEIAKRKIIAWPGGPASKPYVDWGWIVAWLVRAYAAAQSGQLEELAALGEEAGAKAREWGSRPPGDNYGSAELAEDLKSYAGSLASGT